MSGFQRQLKIMQTHICMFQTFLLNLVTSDIDSAKTRRAGFDFRN